MRSGPFGGEDFGVDRGAGRRCESAFPRRRLVHDFTNRFRGNASVGRGGPPRLVRKRTSATEAPSVPDRTGWSRVWAAGRDHPVTGAFRKPGSARKSRPYGDLPGGGGCTVSDSEGGRLPGRLPALAEVLDDPFGLFVADLDEFVSKVAVLPFGDHREDVAGRHGGGEVLRRTAGLPDALQHDRNASA